MTKIFAISFYSLVIRWPSD